VAGVSSSSRIQDSGRTEGNRFTDLAAGDAARLTAEGNAPNLMGSGEISSPSKTPEKDTYQTKEVCEPVESSGVRGKTMARDLLIPTLTETLPVLSPGTVSTILGENWETGGEHEQPPVYSHFMSLYPCRRRTLFGVLRLSPHSKSDYSPAGIFTSDISV